MACFLYWGIWGIGIHATIRVCIIFYWKMLVKCLKKKKVLSILSKRRRLFWFKNPKLTFNILLFFCNRNAVILEQFFFLHTYDSFPSPFFFFFPRSFFSSLLYLLRREEIDINYILLHLGIIWSEENLISYFNRKEKFSLRYTRGRNFKYDLVFWEYTQKRTKEFFFLNNFSYIFL